MTIVSIQDSIQGSTSISHDQKNPAAEIVLEGKDGAGRKFSTERKIGLALLIGSVVLLAIGSVIAALVYKRAIPLPDHLTKEVFTTKAVNLTFVGYELSIRELTFTVFSFILGGAGVVSTGTGFTGTFLFFITDEETLYEKTLKDADSSVLDLADPLVQDLNIHVLDGQVEPKEGLLLEPLLQDPLLELESELETPLQVENPDHELPNQVSDPLYDQVSDPLSDPDIIKQSPKKGSQIKDIQPLSLTSSTIEQLPPAFLEEITKGVTLKPLDTPPAPPFLEEITQEKSKQLRYINKSHLDKIEAGMTSQKETKHPKNDLHEDMKKILSKITGNAPVVDDDSEEWD